MARTWGYWPLLVADLLELVLGAVWIKFLVYYGHSQGEVWMALLVVTVL